MKDYYKLLGLSRSTSQDEITRRCIEWGESFRPDANPGNEKAARRFKEIEEAFAQLGTVEVRAEYDLLLSRLAHGKIVIGLYIAAMALALFMSPWGFARVIVVAAVLVGVLALFVGAKTEIQIPNWLSVHNTTWPNAIGMSVGVLILSFTLDHAFDRPEPKIEPYTAYSGQPTTPQAKPVEQQEYVYSNSNSRTAEDGKRAAENNIRRSLAADGIVVSESEAEVLRRAGESFANNARAQKAKELGYNQR
jgi:hypothetical protein